MLTPKTSFQLIHSSETRLPLGLAHSYNQFRSSLALFDFDVNTPAV